eukprot:550620-Pleurochrysis_carterae.AAC.1
MLRSAVLDVSTLANLCCICLAQVVAVSNSAWPLLGTQTDLADSPPCPVIVLKPGGFMLA